MWVAFFLLIVCSMSIKAQTTSTPFSQRNEKETNIVGELPVNGAPIEEVVVESSLYIKPKVRTNVRRTRRSVLAPLLFNSLIEHKRVKRIPQQRRRQPQLQPDYSQSQAAANAAANNHYQDQFGSGASAANALAQAFNSKGAAGSFGASSAGSVTQAHNNDRFGNAANSFGASLGQTYTLPNGQTINFSSANTLANGPNGNNANSRGSSVSVSKPLGV